MKKLIYIANIRLPTEKAHGVQIMKMCEAFADNGAQVELIIPNRNTQIKTDYFDFYGVKKNFKITKIWCLDIVYFGWLGFWIQQMTFMKLVFLNILFKKGIFYTREEFIAFVLSLTGKKVVWEVHMGQKNIFVQFLIWRQVPMVTISQGLKDLYVSMGKSMDNILVAHDGVDIEQFNIKISKQQIRRELGFSQNRKLVVYTGSRQPWKGVEVLERASKFLAQNTEVLIISGKPYTEIPKYLKVADILVIPNTAKAEISRFYTSPMKLFEYMASGVPIVASYLPSIREILDENTTYFFEPDNPQSLANTINHVLDNYQEAEKRAFVALKKVEEYSWKKRVNKILTFINV